MITRATLFGLLVVGAGGALGLWNEMRTAARADLLALGAGRVIETTPDTIPDSVRGALVHVQGIAQPDGVLTDPLFDLSEEFITLTRRVEMYQWDERRRTRTDSNGRKRTEYEYDEVWSERLIDSDGFRRSMRHPNPPTMPVTSQRWTADTVFLGTYELDPVLVEKIPGPYAQEPTPSWREALTDSLGQQFTLSGTTLYSGNPAHPRVGDLRIEIEATRSTQVSIVAQERDGMLVPFTHPAGEIALVSMGLDTPDEMFAQAQSSNTGWGRVIRVGAIALALLGLVLAWRGRARPAAQ